MSIQSYCKKVGYVKYIEGYYIRKYAQDDYRVFQKTPEENKKIAVFTTLEKAEDLIRYILNN